MACGCNSAKLSARGQTWGVKMPGPSGLVKSYAAEVTARAVVAATPGSVLIPPRTSV